MKPKFAVEYAVMQRVNGEIVRAVQSRTGPMSFEATRKWRDARYADNQWGDETAWPEFVIVPVS